MEDVRADADQNCWGNYVDFAPEMWHNGCYGEGDCVVNGLGGSRRLFLKRAAAIVAMPAIVRVEALMVLPRKRICRSPLTLAEYMDRMIEPYLERLAQTYVNAILYGNGMFDTVRLSSIPYHEYRALDASSVPDPAIIPPQSRFKLVGSAGISNEQALLYEGNVTEVHENHAHSNDLSDATKLRMIPQS